MSCEIYTNGSNPSLNFSGGNIPPGFCPSSWQEVFNQFWALLIGTFPGNFATFIIGSDLPSADDQDKLWFKLDAANNCSPLGWYIYHSGSWVRAQPHPVLPGTIIPYYNSVFDTYIGTQAAIDEQVRSYVEALELEPGETVGANPYWALCDGTRGTPDLRGRFIVSAGTVHGHAIAVPPTVIADAPLDMQGRTLSDRKQYKYNPPSNEGIGGEEVHLLVPGECPITPTPTLSGGSGGLFFQNANQTHNTLPPYGALYLIMKTARRF